MRKAVVASVIVTLLVAAGFAVLGIATDSSFFGIAVLVASVGLGAALVGVMAVLVSLVGTVQRLTLSLEEVTAQSLSLLGGVTETVSGVNTELARVDSIIANAQHVSERAQSVSDVLHAALTTPIIKLMAFGTGTRVAVQTARKGGASA